MKKYHKISLILILPVIFLACSQRVVCKKNYDSVSMVFKNELASKVKKFVNYSDSLAENSDVVSKSSIIFISIFEKNDSCFVLIGVGRAYNQELMLGYVFNENKLIVVYAPSVKCKDNWINTEKLLTKTPINSFYEINSPEISDDIFDPWGWKFLIRNSDKMDLIHQGGF